MCGTLTVGLRSVNTACLTFELSGRRRQDARPGLAKMYRVPPDRAWWPAVGAPLERGVRHQCERLANRMHLDASDSGAGFPSVVPSGRDGSSLQAAPLLHVPIGA